MSDQDKGRELEVVAWALQEIGDDAIPVPSFTTDADHAQGLDCTGRFAVEPLTPLAPAQEALDQAEAQEIRLNEALAESETALREAEHRLERVRGVVMVALAADPDHANDWFHAALEALTPEDWEWAEGE